MSAKNRDAASLGKKGGRAKSPAKQAASRANGAKSKGRPRKNEMSKKLTNDIARCDGYGSIEDGVQYWREGCETCLRRTAPGQSVVSMIKPPDIIAFECENLIEPIYETPSH